MADQVNELNDVEKLFQATIMTILGISPTDFSKVRVSWPAFGAPAWKIDEDVAFLRCVEIDDKYNRQREALNKDGGTQAVNQETGYTRVWDIGLIFYGPNSYNHAWKVKDGFFSQSVKDVMKRANFYLIPDITSIRRVPEQFASQWWERADVSFQFNESVVRKLVVSAIASVPLTVVSDGGIVVEQTIE